jgi:hypothetical protein
MLVVADKDFNIYFISRRKTQKSRNLASNPQASISLGEAPPFTFQFFGRVKEITDAKLRSAITKKWTEQAATLNDVWPPILRQTGGEFAYYVLKPSRVTALDLRHQNIEGGDSLYVKII